MNSTDDVVRQAVGPARCTLVVAASRRLNALGKELQPYYKVVLNGVPIFGPERDMQRAVDFFAKVRVALNLEIRR